MSRQSNTKKQFLGNLFTKLIDFAKKTTVHGVPLIVAPRVHPLERMFWLTVILSAMFGAFSLATQNLNRYYANPTVISLQKDFRNWYNPFPSATACFTTKVDEELVEEYIENRWDLSAIDSKFVYYWDFIMTVANISYYSLSKLERFRNDTELNSIDLLEITAKVHPALTGTLVTFDTTRDTDWTLIMTELGICFSVNTKFVNLFTYKVDGINESRMQDDYILKCHYLNGLCYARYDSEPLAPLQIFIHSYLDVIHTSSDRPLLVKESQELEINFKMQETIANPSIRSLSPAQRRCRFDNEPINSDFPVYSSSICYVSCRYRLVMKLCGCRPFFYVNLPGKVCDIAGLLCLAKHTELLTSSPSEIGCDCPPPCNRITYLAQVPKVTMWEYGYFDQRITFRWGLLPPTTLYERDILFGFEDLVVSIGGTLALFLGVSFITAIELAFFLIDVVLYVLIPKRRRHTVINLKAATPKLHKAKLKRTETQQQLLENVQKSHELMLHRRRKANVEIPLPFCN